MIRLYHRKRKKSTLWLSEIYLFMQQICKFKEQTYGIGIEVAFCKSVLSRISDPGLRYGENIILRTERVAALAVYSPDFQDRETLPVEGMVRMEYCCCSQIPAVIKCFLLLLCRPLETGLFNKPVR